MDEILRKLPALLGAIFTAILFIQSGLDKVFDRGGNLGFIRHHFAKTPLGRFAGPMLATLTLLEIGTGLTAAAGVVQTLSSGSVAVMHLASIAGAVTITALFFGQRVAKDYAGAAVLVPYFILQLIVMYLTSMN